MTIITPTNPSALAEYLRDNIYDKLRKEREATIEPKWQKNIDAFNAVVNSEYWKEGETEGWRSDTFIKLTKQKIVTAYSMIVDIILQGGKIPFSLLPSPWDTMVFKDLPEEQKKRLEDDIDEMEDLINQQFQDCSADREMMKNIMSGAIYGETIGKKYVHEVIRTGYKKISLAPQGLQDQQGQYDRFEAFKKTKDAPAYRHISNWNFFRDLETNDLQTGLADIERDLVSPFWLRKKKGQPFWIDDAIDRAIKNARKPGDTSSTGSTSDTSSLPPFLRTITNRHNTIENLEFWTRVPTEIVEQFEKDLKKKGHFTTDIQLEYDGNETEIMAVMSDAEVTRYAKAEEGKRPFYRVEWEMKPDHAEGIGVADNLEDVQKVLNGMIRAFENNKKLSANVMGAGKSRLMPDWDGSFKPGQFIEVAEEVDDARMAFQQIIVADVGETLLSGIALFERYADESSMLPKLLAGSVLEKQKPDTLGELHMLQQNSGKYLGSVIKNFDEGIIEPVVTDFYHYIMDDPEVEKGKGNFIAKALGFTSFQDKIIRVQKIMQAINLALSDDRLAQEVKFRDLLEEIYKALDLEPSQILKTPDEKQQEQEQQLQMIAMQEAKAKRMRDDALMVEEEQKDTDLDREIDKEDAKHENALEMEDVEFEHEVALKTVPTPKTESK